LSPLWKDVPNLLREGDSDSRMKKKREKADMTCPINQATLTKNRAQRGLLGQSPSEEWERMAVPFVAQAPAARTRRVRAYRIAAARTSA
jgi:hypothetical protein